MPSDAETKKNAEDLFEFTKRIIPKIMNADFMGKKPNNNSSFEDALSILTMSTMNLFLYIRDNSQNNNSLVAGILTRSLIEATANIKFLVENREDEKIITDFLNTSHLVPKKLYDIKFRTTSKGIRWTNVSITDRVSQLNSSSSLNYLAAWHYFSSYSHSDAGYLGSYYHNQNKRMPSITLMLSCMTIIEIGGTLDSIGLIKGGFNKAFYEAAKAYLAKNK